MTSNLEIPMHLAVAVFVSLLPPAHTSFSSQPIFMSYPGGQRSVGTVGDVDSDGRSDLLVGVVTRREKWGRHPGGVYLFSGPPYVRVNSGKDGAVIYTLPLPFETSAAK